MSQVTAKKKPRGPATVLAGSGTEFGDYHSVNYLFGLRRGLIYHLWKIGAIESISLSDEVGKRGKRLFYIPSVRAYLNSKREHQQVATDEKIDKGTL
jgi:hypothetical protein